MTIPAQWTAVELAIQTWVVTASGIPTERVNWSLQGGNRPPGDGPWISLSMNSIRSLGRDWVDAVDVDGPPGAEIEHRLRGDREAALRIQCYRGGAVGAVAPVMRLDAVQSAAGLPGIRAALRAAGIGVLRFDPPRAVDGVLGSSVFEPRAVATVYLHLPFELAESGTYIEFVELKPQAPLPGGPIVVPPGRSS